MAVTSVSDKVVPAVPITVSKELVLKTVASK